MPDEYISRAEALRAVQKQRGANRSPAQNAMLDRICCDIKNMPAADVAPVVRCRDCKYGELYSRNDGRTGVYCKCKISTFTYANDHTFTPVRNEDDFCSYGPRE